MKYIYAFSILCSIICGIQCSKILVVFPVPAYSHFSLGFRIVEELLAKGHEVTFINPYPQKNPIKNLRDVSVEENIVWVEELKKQLLDMDKKSSFENTKMLNGMSSNMTRGVFGNERVQKLIKSGEKFDLVIIEQFIGEALVGFGHIFKAPIIYISPMPNSGMNNYLYANPAPSSYVTSYPMWGTSNKKNFWHRLKNLLLNAFMDVIRETITLPSQRELFKKYVDPNLELDDVLYNTSLMLTNSHYSVNDAVPLVPNIIEIGGYHIKPPKKLPEDIQKFLDDAKEGVVLFSMGSNLKSKDLTPEARAAILKSFSKLKQKVLWKFETDLPEAPKNVKILNWVPQQDVLAHPNVKAFISHGGLLSTLETVYFGVPIVGIPVFGDQKSNIASAVANGYAVQVPLSEISEEKLSWALNEVLNNPKYSENIKRRSSLMRDRPLSPIDTAIYWIEHVIRHKGAPHLRSAGLDLKWYQRDMLDITIFLTVVTIALFVIFYIIIKKILGLCRSKTKKTVSKSKKNK